MQEGMNLSINGVSKVPPGFRFHPTEEELLHYYLRKKVSSQKIDLDVIPEVDLNKLEPWDIQEKCKIGSTQSDWYLFSHKDKKYPTGSRTNRATGAGFWKATGRDKIINSCYKRIGLRKTLVFYKGRAPHGQKSDWIMHEYRLDDDIDHNINNVELSSSSDSSIRENGWVVCRVFMKKNYQKVLGSPKSYSNYSMGSSMQTVYSNDVLDQILHCMGQNSTTLSNCKTENNDQSPNDIDIMISNQHNHNNNNIKILSENDNIFCINDIINGDDKFMHLPKLENPTIILNNTNLFKSCNHGTTIHDRFDQQHTENIDWVGRALPSHHNGQDLQPFDTTFGICPGYDVDEEDYIQLSRDEHYNLNIDTSSINGASLQIYNMSNQSQNDLWPTFSNGSSTSNSLRQFSV